MEWHHHIIITNGGGATADPVASPATVPAANCFRLKKRDTEVSEMNTCVMFSLEAPTAESVGIELYALNDDDDTGSNNPPATGRWSRICRINSLLGGRISSFSPFSGAGKLARSGLLYLRVVAEGVTADRLVQVASRPGYVSDSSGVVEGSVDAIDSQVWPSLAGAAADPTAAFVASTYTFELGSKSFLLGQATVTVLGCEGIQIRAERSTDSGGTWREVSIVTIPAAAIGTHQFVMDLPEDGLYRLSARRFGGGGTTRLVLSAEAVERPVEIGRDGNPIELLVSKEDGVLSWHNAGAAEALGLAYATSTSGLWIPVGRANNGKLVVTLTGNVATTVEAQIHESPDDTPTDLIPELTNWIAGNIRNVGPAEHQISGANGTYVIRFHCEPGALIRTYLKYTGGLAPNALGRLYLWKE